ncbi:DoxX family protein [Caldibacillus lycopersici]|uniref:DoxX family protein n=1 Tax=Perspicuibacillus lycopersici TaxID=1325689 RepID=A0AAE3IUD4_9BACI|nr:DoxX family protein [Perspicuibacillus lycopersici]MCU9614602.1 DoxX family protein [Perspicuibacillus lycopersici]MCU9614605.1 DoxX family protein [Perspicuibacillus lycopersici]
MKKQWFNNPIVNVIWTVARIWLGLQWIEGAWHKFTGGFDAAGFLQGAIAKAGGEAPVVQGWYGAFLEHFAMPNVEIFNVVIPVGEFLVGIGLILGAATIPALIAGAFMNLNFLLAGTISTNPVLLAVAVILLFIGAGTYYYGVDRFAVPMIKTYFANRHNRGNKVKKVATV